MKKGFTLIELLIVIAILGTLAVVILIALNPVQQLARTRDAGRISGVTQLGHAIEAYATSNSGIYPPESNTWVQVLVNRGEISVVPSLISNSLSALCTVNAQNGWCYDTTGGDSPTAAVVFARLESDSHIGKCTGANPTAYAAYSTSDSRGGVVCGAAPTAVSLQSRWVQ